MMRNMTILFLLICICSCRSVKTVENTQVCYDSVYSGTTNIQEVSLVDFTKVIHDSIYTHVTIFRYDTIFVSGSPVIKEKIEIEQVKVSGETSNDLRKDSITFNEDVTCNIEYVETNDRVTERENRVNRLRIYLFAFGAICIILVLLIKKGLKE